MQYRKHWREIQTSIRNDSFPLIDVRSEKEFERGHIPLAQNIPLLNNLERHEVGSTYKKRGKVEAVALGLELFAEKAQDFLDQVVKICGTRKMLALYCWRGGMRSRLAAMWLELAGFRTIILEGGYKFFRRDVLEALEKLANHRMIVLNGRTGSGKTKLIDELSAEGLPVIDLEGIAKHRGSAFGGIGQDKGSPTQQNFENQLYDRYLDISHHEKILFEIENFIGPVVVPQKVRNSIKKAPMVFVEREFEDRVKLLSDTYCKDWTQASDEAFENSLVLLRKYLSIADCEKLIEAVKDKRFSEVISQLLHLRYDRVYDKSLAKYQPQALAHFNLSKEEHNAKDFLKRALRK